MHVVACFEITRLSFTRPSYYSFDSVIVQVVWTLCSAEGKGRVRSSHTYNAKCPI